MKLFLQPHITGLLGILLTSTHLLGSTLTLITNDKNQPEFSLDGRMLLKAPEEGLWSVATEWKDDWMTGWKHANPNQVERYQEWTILSGSLKFPGGEMVFRDAYRPIKDNLIQCIRRFEWKGDQVLETATLSVRYKTPGEKLRPFMPGIVQYGNLAGAKMNDRIIPVYKGKEGEFAIFEDHRYSIPYVSLDNDEGKYSVAIHSTPSPVRGGILKDQWWSLGVEAYKGYTEFVLYSGPIGYNKQRSVAKALQMTPMKYTDTYLSIEPGTVIEKKYYIEAYPIKEPGSGFQQAMYTAFDLHKPYNYERFPSFKEIIQSKYLFALSRWIDEGGVSGFCMYPGTDNEIVMGWCGQADSLGYALPLLEGKYIQDDSIQEKVQKLMDFLTTYPVDEDGEFRVNYNIKTKQFSAGDPVSCGSAMNNFARAIELARKSKKYDYSKWEIFLKKICDGRARSILNDKNWHPLSSREAFYISPLYYAYKLYGKKEYRDAALKIARHYAQRHLSMEEPYWGGTLDAKCEDKEGSWACFQGFLLLYENGEGDEFLTWAKHAMDVTLAYNVIWDIPLPPGRMADHNFKTTGWTDVSPQNQHIDVYGVIYAPEIYRMGQILKDQRLMDISRVMYRSCFQLIDPFGSQGEQIQQTNFAQHGDMSNVHKLRGGYSEKWTVFWITAHFLNAAAKFEAMGIEP